MSGTLTLGSKLAVVEGVGVNDDHIADEWEPGVPITSPCDNVTVSDFKPGKRGLNSRLMPVLRGEGGMVLTHYLITWLETDGHHAQTQRTARNFLKCKLFINLGILYCMAASRMQFASGWRLTEWKLHPAGGHQNEICIPLAASWMKFAPGWWPTRCKFSKNTQLAHCLAASVLQARWDYIFINHNLYRWNINIKTNCGSQTGKSLANHESFSPSQSHETVPLKGQ